MKRLFIAALLIGALVGMVAWYPGYHARQACEDRVRTAYAQADRVGDQPIDLGAFCAAWHNQPPGYAP